MFIPAKPCLAHYVTMSSTGYNSVLFTEINPTSTLTTMDLWYNEEWTDAGHWDIGPFGTIYRHRLLMYNDTYNDTSLWQMIVLYSVVMLSLRWEAGLWRGGGVACSAWGHNMIVTTIVSAVTITITTTSPPITVSLGSIEPERYTYRNTHWFKFPCTSSFTMSQYC